MRYLSGILFFFILFSCASLGYADTKVYFSPNGGCQEAVIAEISHAQKSIDIAMYSFTSREIAQALVEAKERKIKIRIVLDKAQKKERYSKSRYFLNKGFDVKFHVGSGLMHNKFAVVDGKVLITGSFNWTAAAEKKNEENLLILTDESLIKTYEVRFEHLWQLSKEEASEANQTDEE